jgi:hypothetical protein
MMAVGDKTLHFQGKGKDLDALADQIEEYLKSEKFSVQRSAPSSEGTASSGSAGSAPSGSGGSGASDSEETAPTGEGVVIQAKKGGFLRGVVDADRALTVMISGDPNDLTVRVGIGKWLEHAGVAAAEALLLSALFLAVDVPETAWNFEIEDKLAKQIESFVET